MAVKGVFASDSNIQGTRKGDFAGALLQTMPTGSAPLLALTSGMNSAGATDSVVTWFEENHLSGRVNVTNNATTGATFTIDDPSSVIAGQIYIIEASGEYVYIDSITGTSATVTRGFAGTSNGSINGSSTPVPIQLVSNANEEGSDRPPAIANLGFPRFNYCQIFRNSWDVTGSAKAIDYYTGDPVAKNKRDASVLHSEAIERSLLWGRKSIGVLNNKPFRTMDGIVTQLEASDSAATQKTESSNTKWSDIDTFLMGVFSTNIKGQPNERIAFCDNTVLSVLHGIARINGVMEIMVGQTDFGMNINKWISPYGTITVLTHPLMNEAVAWRSQMYLLHPAAIRTRYLRRTAEDPYDANGSRNGVDADFGVITTEMSCEYKATITGGVYKGMSTAAAEA